MPVDVVSFASGRGTGPSRSVRHAVDSSRPRHGTRPESERFRLGSRIAPALATPLRFALLLVLAPFAAAQEPHDTVDKDYSDELPRIAPVEPSDAAATFRVADGFRIELVAAEPLVTDPIAVDFDGDGRLYVVEMRDYSEHPDESLGRIRRLVDENGDGRFDSSTIFAEGLSWPTAILCARGGVLVGAPPDLLLLTDADGDGIAERRERVATGFSRSNVQGMMNSLRWGLDHRIHGSASTTGASLITDANPDAPPLELRGRDFAWDPIAGTIEPTAGGGQHGMDFDRWGEKFVCSNSDHLRFARYEDRYLGRNPWFAAPAPTISIAADGPQADVYRSSPIEPWRIVRTRLRATGVVPGLVEGGGRPAGYFTGATGVTLYEPDPTSDELPWAIVADVGSNLVHRKRLTRVGNSYVGERIDVQSEFVASTDIWFRPVQFAIGPDAALYVIDMYREVIEHPASLPEPIKKHLDLDSGRDRGRIWRVVPERFEQPPPPRLESASNEQLVEALADRRIWWRRTATRLLIERRDPRAVPLLVARWQAADRTPLESLHLLSALDAYGALDETIVIDGLSDPDSQVRRWSLIWSERIASPSAALVRAIAATADDPALEVRTQAAFTLGAFRSPAADAALARIARRDHADEVARTAVTSSLGAGSTTVIESLLTSETVRDTDTGKAWIAELLGQVAARGAATERAELLAWLERWSESDLESHRALIEQLERWPTDHAWRTEIDAALGPDAAVRWAEAIAGARERAIDRTESIERRIEAIAELRRADEATLLSLLAGLIVPTEAIEVQQSAIDALLARGGTPTIGRLLIEKLPELSPALRRRAMEGLLERTLWTVAVLEALEAGTLQATDLDPSQLRRLSDHSDATVRELAAHLIAAPGPRDELIATYRAALDREGDRERGRATFVRVCANCHRVDGVGHEVGPSLASFRNRGAEALMTNVIDPNREINPQFVAYAASMVDGRQVVGMIDGETAASVTLRQAEGKTETLRRGDLDDLRSTGVSLMPEGLEREITVDQMADLIAYLMSDE